MTNQQQICSNLSNNELRQSKSNRKPVSDFAAKEYYIEHLAEEEHSIELDTHHPNDGYIYIKGVLVIDERCNPYWDWSDVIATSAVIKKDKDGHDMVKMYQRLPKTYKGIKTTLKPPTVESYMLHNNYGAKVDEEGIYHIETLRIPPHAEHLDFSCVEAEVTLFFSDNSIALSKLPYSKNLFGINIGRLDIDCDDPYEVAKEKGCGHKILNALAPKKKNIFTGFAGYIGSIVGFGDAKR